MLHLYDRATMARASIMPFDDCLYRLLKERIDALVTDAHDLTDSTEFLILQPGDTEADIVRHVGFSPLVEPIEGHRFGSIGFQPFWDWLADRGGYFEMIVTFGSIFAYILLIPDRDDILTDLRAICRRYTT